jgi:histidinol phosphatase-like enzyme (inositol monophosphatase family)
MGSMPLTTRLALALDLARSAGAVALDHFTRQGLRIDTKEDGTPVTAADRECENFLRGAIRDAFPDDGALGEEFPESKGRSGFRWVIDPIDGTMSFIHGVPLWGTLVAVERENRSVAGVIHMPALGETVYAATGEGAWHIQGSNPPTRARVSSVDSLEDSVLCITSPGYPIRAGRTDLLVRLGERFGTLRGWSDCYGHILAATGRVEAVVEPVVAPWDVAASIIIMQEAGGRYTDWRGLETAHSPDALLTNGHIHEEALMLLR